MWPYSIDAMYWKSMIILGFLTVWFIVFYQIWFRMDDWAYAMAGQVQAQSPTVERIWVITGLRLVYLVYGLHVLASNCEFIIDSFIFVFKGPRILSDMFQYRYIDKLFLIPFSAYLKLVVNFFFTILAMYFLAGAPHILRWQLRRFFTAGPNH